MTKMGQGDAYELAKHLNINQLPEPMGAGLRETIVAVGFRSSCFVVWKGDLQRSRSKLHTMGSRFSLWSQGIASFVLASHNPSG